MSLCPRHVRLIETTRRIWSHLDDTEITAREDVLRSWCLDCQGTPQPVQHLAREIEGNTP